MPAELDQEMGVLSLVCDTCEKEETVPLGEPNDLDWRFKDGTPVFCSLSCEMKHEVKNQGKAAA